MQQKRQQLLKIKLCIIPLHDQKIRGRLNLCSRNTAKTIGRHKMLSLGGGQSIEDKLQAVKYFLSGQGLSFVVLKATTSELMGPKKKHLNYLVTITNEPNVSIPSLVKYLMQRARQPEWCVAFKSIITVHHLMSYASDRFIQNLASSTANNRHFDYLASFVDRTTSLAFNMSTFVRRHSRYLSAKIHAYRSLGLDFCKMESFTSSDKTSPFKLRTFSNEQLITILPVLQNQFDALLAFDASPKDLNNGIINSAFAMLYKDFVKLYIFYQTAIVRLLELYFTVNQAKRAQELLEAYKRFLVRMDKVSDFIRVIDSVGMDKSDMPNVSRAPSLSLKLLEKHVKQLESSVKKQQPLNRIQSVELPRIGGYATLQGKRRSLRTPSRLTNQVDTGSPDSRLGHKRRVESLLSEQSGPTSQQEDCSSDKRKKDCDNEEKHEETSAQDEHHQPIPSAPPYDLLSLSAIGAINEEHSTCQLVASNAKFDEQQEDLIIMTDPSEGSSQEVQSTKTVSNDTSTRCQASSSPHPTEWVQVDL